MRKIIDMCCDCATETYPCLGSSCPNRNVRVYYCDHCKCEIDGDIYEADGEELCEECLLKLFRRIDNEY